MSDITPPEMFSIALSNGNKATLGLRHVPISQSDWVKINQFLELMKDTLVRPDMPMPDSVFQPSPLEHWGEAPPKENELPTPHANAGRVLHGHIPSEAEMATASERIALRENIRWTAQALQDSRLEQLREKRLAMKSSKGSEDDSQS